MEEKRKGEIALAILKLIAKKEPIRLHKDYDLASTELGIPKDEIKEFTKEILNEIVDES